MTNAEINDSKLTRSFLSGDGKLDYLCMEKSGRTTAWLHKGPGNWVSVGQVKKSEGWDRANIQWADTNGKLSPSSALGLLRQVPGRDAEALKRSC